MLASIFIYLTAFGISIVSAYILDIDYKLGKQSSLTKSFLFLFIIIPPCLLAALRDYSVGVDLLNFVNGLYPIALNSESFKSFYIAGDSEILYSLLVYIGVKLTGGISLYLFVNQLLVIAPITVVAYKKRNEIPIWATISVYLFVFFNNSLNLMQQSMACSTILLCVVLWFEKKKVKSVFLFVIAVLLHQSAIFILPFLITAQIIIKDRKNKWRRFLVIISGIVIFDCLFEKVVTWIIYSTNLLPPSYEQYYNIFIAKSSYSSYFINPWSSIYCMVDLGFRISFVVLPILALKKQAIHNLDIRMEEGITFSSMIFYFYVLLKFNTMYGGRITLLGDYFLILLVARLTKIRSDISKLFFWGLILTYWFVFVIRLGWSGSSNYFFRF